MRKVIICMLVVLLIGCSKTSIHRYGVSFQKNEKAVLCEIRNYYPEYDVRELFLRKEGVPYGRYYLRKINSTKKSTIFQLEDPLSNVSEFPEGVYYYTIRKPAVIYEGYIYMMKSETSVDVYTKEGNF